MIVGDSLIQSVSMYTDAVPHRRSDVQRRSSILVDPRLPFHPPPPEARTNQAPQQAGESRCEMGQFPTSPRETVLQFGLDHQDVWDTNHTAIGLSTAQVAAFKVAVSACQGAFTDQSKAKQAAKIATQGADDAYKGYKAKLAEMVRTIKTFAENSATPATVYNTAEIIAPAPPSPVPPPAQPSGVTVSLNASSGALELKWKASNPAGSSGTSYIIRRKLPGEPSFSFLGVSGKKAFTDNTLVAGPDSVQYTIQGQRSDAAGPVSAVLTVTFGHPATGGFNVQSVKLAA
jgi:hypothetical protein